MFIIIFGCENGGYTNMGWIRRGAYAYENPIQFAEILFLLVIVVVDFV